jgi:guanylate kinase
LSLSTEHWHKPDHGALFVVTGASGTGKTTLVRAALQTIPGLCFSVSATTRPARTGEVDGKDYHFVDPADFDQRIAAGDFLEWAEVYGNRYGTLSDQVERNLAAGQSILLDIDIQGAAQVRRAAPDAVTIFILPPSIDILAERLRARGTDNSEVIDRRIREAEHQLSECGSFDYLVVNDHLPSAHDQFQAVLVAELLRSERSPSLVRGFIK